MAIRPILDTSSIIAYRTQIESVIYSAYIPSIVFFELLATSIGQSELQMYTRWRTRLKEIDRVISPTEVDS